MSPRGAEPGRSAVHAGSDEAAGAVVPARADGRAGPGKLLDLAEHAGESGPDGMQRLLARAVGDAAVRDDLRGYVVDRLGTTGAVLVVDETGDLKKGTATVGVQRQYTGTAGRIEKPQVAVYLTYANDRGHAFIDRALYLPVSWTDDPARCAAAGVPEGTGFATKPALAGRMLTAAFDAGVAAGWVELSAGAGSKGHRYYDWALVDTTDQRLPGRRWLLVRRNQTTGEYAFYRAHAHALGPAPLATLVRVAGRRWTVEETIQTSRELTALDQHQVRTWTSWHRWTIFAMLAHAFLTITAADQRDQPTGDDSLLPIAVNETRRLFNAIIGLPAATLDHALRWSRWRRHHQADARASHYRRRGHHPN